MRARPGVAALACLTVVPGCGGDLLEGEIVVPGEVAAESFRGAPGAGLGASVALGDAELLAGAPGCGEVWTLPGGEVSSGPEGLGRPVWWSGGERFAAAPGSGVYRAETPAAELAWEAAEVRVFAAGEAGDGLRVAGSGDGRIWLWDGDGSLLATLALDGVQRLAIGRERVLLLACAAGDCRALAWWPEDGDLLDLGEAGDGGALVELDGRAWWGLPELDRPDAAGRVCGEEGDCIEGIDGDHLGRALCAGYAAGVFNTRAVPSRLRVVPLGEGPVLAFDRGAPGRPATLDCRGGQLAVGQPSAGLLAPGEGWVLWVDLDDLP